MVFVMIQPSANGKLPRLENNSDVWKEISGFLKKSKGPPNNGREGTPGA